MSMAERLEMHCIDIRRDYRFTLEEQYSFILNRLKGEETITTVMHPIEGHVVGWRLHGWTPPPPVILYISDFMWWYFEGGW